MCVSFGWGNLDFMTKFVLCLFFDQSSNICLTLWYLFLSTLQQLHVFHCFVWIWLDINSDYVLLVASTTLNGKLLLCCCINNNVIIFSPWPFQEACLVIPPLLPCLANSSNSRRQEHCLARNQLACLAHQRQARHQLGLVQQDLVREQPQVFLDKVLLDRQ